MSREEAIKILKEDGCGYCTWQSINPYECENKECKVKEALNMAIQALEKENIYDDGEHYVTISKALYDKLNIDYDALSQEPTVQDKQAESEKYQKAFDDGYANGYAQARFDYGVKEIIREIKQEPCDDAVSQKENSL